MELLKDKRALVVGVANERSIAWGIAQALKEQGASIAMTYLNDALKKRVEPLAEKVNSEFIAPLDITKPEELTSLKGLIQEKWGKFDILVHSMAYAKTEDLKGEFLETSREGFLTAMEISAYSLVEMCRVFQDLMPEEASVIAMTYHGSQKVITNYNVMGVAKAALEASVRYLACDLGKKKIRINAISAGPIKTLSASGISGFRGILKKVEETAPLQRNVDIQDVGNTALYLASPFSQGITGQVIYVDSGHSIMGNV